MKKIDIKKLIKKNSKLVKLFSFTLCALLICTAFSFLVVGIVKRVKTEIEQSKTEQTQVITQSTITYRAVLDGVVIYVDEDFYLPNGYYPELYKDGMKVHIDDLREFICVDSLTDYYFVGWYTDSKCTKPFENDVARIGNFVVYAKLGKALWTPNY